MFLGSILIHTICPFWDRNHISSFLKNSSISSLIDERAPVEPSDLTPSHIGNLKVRMEEQIEAKGEVFARIVDAYIEMEFFLS